MDYTRLTAEIQSDPLGRGYAAMTDQQVADSLDTADRAVDRDTITSAELVECLVPAEYAALTAAQKTLLHALLAVPSFSLARPNTRAMLGSLFGAGTEQRANLVALQSTQIPRWKEIGLSSRPDDQHIASARRIING